MATTARENQAKQAVQLIPYDFEHYVEVLVGYLQANMPNDYQDFLESNAARVLIDAIAYELSLVAYMINVNVKQWFLPTTSTRRASYLLGKLVNYDLAGPIPSVATITFSLTGPHTVDIVIPIGAQIQVPGETPVIFEVGDSLEADRTISAGSTEIDIPVTQGQTIIEIIGTTTSEVSQTFKSSYSLLIETVEVWVGNNMWTRFDSLYDMNEEDKGYTASPDENLYAVITFGNGVFGQIPPTGQQLTLHYRVGGGANTNVGTNQITEILTTLSDENGEIVEIEATNQEGATGGADAETVEEAKINIPRNVRSMDRLVSHEDFKNISQIYDGVYKSNSGVVYTWTAHVITLYILAKDSDNLPVVPSTALKSEVKSWAQTKTVPTIDIAVESGSLKTITITGTIYYHANYRPNIVMANVITAIADLFDYDERNMGDSMRLSDIYNAIDSADGVSYINLTLPTGDTSATASEFLVLPTEFLKHIDNYLTFTKAE